MEWLPVHSKEKPLSQPSSTASLLDAMDVAAALSCTCQLNMGITYSYSWGSLNCSWLCQPFSCTDQWWTITIQCMYEDWAWVLLVEKVSTCVCVQWEVSLSTDLLQRWMWRWIAVHSYCREIKATRDYLCSGLKFRMSDWSSGLLSVTYHPKTNHFIHVHDITHTYWHWQIDHLQLAWCPEIFP